MAGRFGNVKSQMHGSTAMEEQGKGGNGEAALCLYSSLQNWLRLPRQRISDANGEAPSSRHQLTGP